MTLSAATRQNGRTHHLASELPPKVMTALSLAATGMSWSDAAAQVNMSTEALRKWRHHPDSQGFLETVVRENLVVSKNLAISKSQRMIEILCEIAEDKNARPYARTNAASAVLDKALKFDEMQFQRDELRPIREILEAQEEGRATALIDVSGHQ